MAGYTPIYIKGMETGLVQDRQEFILPNDAYPVLQNAYIFRERIQRKQGVQFVGRLVRAMGPSAFGNFDGAGNFIANINVFFGLEASATITPGSVSIVTAANTFTDINPVTPTDAPNGNLFGGGGTIRGTINYISGDVVLFYAPSAGQAVTITFSYFPNLPVMGILTREINSENNEQTIFFDTVYAYIFNNATNVFQEFLPGTVWTGTDYNFFWGTNYWFTAANLKLFWVTNFSGTGGDPIRYTDGLTWTAFAPVINLGSGDLLNQCLALLPFRGRLVAFRTLEGANLAASVENFQRIRWANIGNPLLADAWHDDVRGKGGFLDIPTSEAIIAVGFVRDNLVVYCERSTWQLRYTGRSIAPFQIEKVNAELGTESTFSAVQFDTSLVGIGDKGIVQCDSYKSERIDIKIPNLVFGFQNIENGNKRVHGIRDFQKKLAYWIYLDIYDGNVTDSEDSTINYPNRRLVYNYENDSWAIFQDSFTVLGNLQFTDSFTWELATFSWESANFPWIGKPPLFPYIAGGNQQGFIFVLDKFTTNEKSLYIKNIVGNDPVITTVNIPQHNLVEDQVIQIVNIPSNDPFFSLNNLIFGVGVVDDDNIELWKYEEATGQFTDPQINVAGTFIGIGYIIVRDGFSIQSKKFNFLDDGQTIQLGYIDVLLNTTTAGAITINVYADYNDSNPLNTYPQNAIESTDAPDTFFNSVIPTSVTINRASNKNWQRVYCSTRASFLTIEYTLSNAQLISQAQQSDVQIDAQIMWVRKAGKQLPIGI